MPGHGPLFPSLGQNIATVGAPWANPQLAADDETMVTSAEATTDPFTAIQSDSLRLTGFGFQIPPEEVVVGVRVLARAFKTAGRPITLRATLVSGGQAQGSPKSAAPGDEVFANVVYGSSSDDWGAPGLTPERLNSAAWGVELVAVDGGFEFVESQTRVMWVSMTVTTELPPPAPGARGRRRTRAAVVAAAFGEAV